MIREVFGYRWDTAYPFEPVRGAYVGRRRGHQGAPALEPDTAPAPAPEPPTAPAAAPAAPEVRQLGLSL